MTEWKRKARSLMLTARPKTLAAAVVPVLVGTALVYTEGRDVSLWISATALLSAIFIQIGTNFVNDAIDYWKGADKETRLGEARASQSGWFSPRAVLLLGFLCFALAALFGLPLAWEGGWPILCLGLVSLAMGYAYTGGPFPLAYLGLGDLFVILFFGLAAVGGVYFLQTKTYTPDAFVAGLQVGLLATVLIAINNLRDLDQDREVGKRTLAVRLGPRLGRLEVLLLVAGTFALNFHWLHRGQWPAFALPLLALPISARVVKTLLQTGPCREYNQILARAAFAHVLFGALLSMGFLLR